MTTVDDRPRVAVPASPTAPSHHLRLDVQGLRALAVLVVIANHAMGSPAGGFLGVDVFFVISGYIITALLLREHERNGRVSLADFYRRRVKRILPASALVLVVTVAASWLLLGGERARKVSLDALAAVFFVSNWRFAAEGTDYWADTGTVSPLQHFWSLGVEEQFYLIWPAIVIVGSALALRRRLSLRSVLSAALLLLLVGSLAWGAVQTTTEPGVAYFSSLTRVWELAVGALVAVATPWLSRVRTSRRPLLAWAGLCGLAYTLVTTGEEGTPVPASILAVLATACIIAAGTGANAPDIWPLTNRATTYIGDISFSLYLWHFPVVVFLAPHFETREKKFLAAVLAITFVLAVATYHLVEDPIRRSSWLKRSSGAKAWAAPAGVAFLLVTVLVVAAALPVAVSSAEAAGGAEEVTTQGHLNALLREALASEQWPELHPSPAEVAFQGLPTEDGEGCSVVDLADPHACSFPHEGADRTAVVMGDSTAIVLLPAIRLALGDGWNVKGLTMAGCYQVDVSRWYDDPERGEICETHQGAALDAVQQLAPDLIIVSDMYTGASQVDPFTDPLTNGGSYQWALATRTLAEQLKAVTDDVVFVQSPPLRVALGECAVAGSVPADCVHHVDELYREVAEGELAAVTSAGAKYLTVEEWFCIDGQCPAFVGSTPTMRDEMHVSRQYSMLLAPLLRQKLNDSGVLSD